MQQELTKFYITKYVLTNGIIEGLGEYCIDSLGNDKGKDMIKVLPENNGGCGYRSHQLYHRQSKEFFEDINDAHAYAEDKRLREISNLKKKIEKLENLKVEVVDMVEGKLVFPAGGVKK